jgi:hypothetical protein
MEENVSVAETEVTEPNGSKNGKPDKETVVRQLTAVSSSPSSRLKGLKIDDERMQKAALVDDFKTNGADSPTRGEARANLDTLHNGEAERLQQLLPEVLKDRPDLYEMLLWDAEHNPQELVSMLGKISGIKGRDGAPPPYEAIVTTLKAIGAINGYTIQRPEMGRQNFGGKERSPTAEGKVENPFRSEMLKLEKVWESVRVEKMKHIDETGKEVEMSYLVVEFSLNSWAQINLPENATDEQKQLRGCVEEYIKCRYKWETNVLKDKKFQVVRRLPSGVNGKLKNVLEMLGDDKNNLYKERGITRDDYQQRVDQNVGMYRYPDMDSISKDLGIDTMLSRNKTIIDFDHGWCGAGADKVFISQAMFAANNAIVRANGQKFRHNQEINIDEEVIGITSDNLGLVRSSREKVRRQRLSASIPKGIRLIFGDKKNPNISDDEFFGIRHGTETGLTLNDYTDDEKPKGRTKKAADPLLTQKEYGRDIFWKKNMVFGVLGETDGKENVVVNGGWSFGGGGLIEYETIVLKHAENAYKEKIWNDKIGPEFAKHAELRQQLKENFQHYIDLNPGFKDTVQYHEYHAMIFDTLPEVMQALMDEYDAIQLPNINDVTDVGMPNQFNIRFAPAVNNSCIFLGESRGIQQFWKKGLSKTSMGIVKLGTYLSNKGLTRLRLGESTLQFIAKLYTGRILPVEGDRRLLDRTPLRKKYHLDEDKKEVKDAGRMHVLNYANRVNAFAVFLETDGLIRYSGLDEDQERLLRTGHSKNITIVSRWDRLVGFSDLTRELAKRDANELCIVPNSGHYASASDTMRQDFPYELLFEATKEERDETLKDWAQIAATNYNMGLKSIRDLNVDEYMSRLKNIDEVYITNELDQIKANDAIVRVNNRFKDKNPKLAGRIRQSTTEMAGILYLPRRRDLRGQELAA